MNIRIKGNLRFKAALYAIGFFVGIFALALGLHAITPYLEPWMGWAVVFGVLFYLVYKVMLTELKFVESIRSIRRMTDIEDKE